MTPAILARLTAGSPDLQPLGGVPELSREEIMGAMAHLGHGASYYAHFVYLGAEGYRASLKNEIRLELAGIWAREGWKVRKPGLLAGLAELLILESTPGNLRCRQCAGQGDRVINGIKVTCDGCAGSGRRRYSDRGRARIVGIDWKHWLRKIRWRYQQYVMPLAGRWEGEIARTLQRQIGRQNSPKVV